MFILIDAVSDHEPVGDLDVEIQVDGTTLLVAKYSSLSGYYGAIWHSSAEKPGTMHTLIAKATDSAGNTKSALVAVSVRQE
ncbi:MAG: hypothetical protein H8D69_02355 [Chloroflexi bacterium]|nr:hypothetical protein [Chloroflexota bacterium]